MPVEVAEPMQVPSWNLRHQLGGPSGVPWRAIVPVILDRDINAVRPGQCASRHTDQDGLAARDGG